jgi:phosphoribosylformylglycinamidine synthase subunit PurQ / glutaminase
MRPRTLVLRTAGTNCDVETAHAFELAGASARRVHLNRVLENPRLLGDFQILAIPGGFSYGDDIAAGRIFANQITRRLRDAVRAFVDAGKPVIGVCNGFQVLVKTDLLPGPIGGREGQTCTLAHNDCGRFIDRWIRVSPRSSKCVWTQGLSQGSGFRVQGSAKPAETPLAASSSFPEPRTLSPKALIELAIAHGEGKFVPADESVRRALWDEDRVALVYVRPDGSAANGEAPDNPNGSVDDIAGVCDASGLVFGLMPHPERHVTPLQHPAWTRRQPLPAEGAGLAMFRNAVRHAAAGVGAGV